MKEWPPVHVIIALMVACICVTLIILGLMVMVTTCIVCITVCIVVLKDVIKK